MHFDKPAGLAGSRWLCLSEQFLNLKLSPTSSLQQQEVVRVCQSNPSANVGSPVSCQKPHDICSSDCESRDGTDGIYPEVG